MHVSTSSPRARDAANAPTNASPAPAVSITDSFARSGATPNRRTSAPAINPNLELTTTGSATAAPFAPRVTTTTTRCSRAICHAASIGGSKRPRSAAGCAHPGATANASTRAASCSLTTRKSTCFRTSAGTAAAGAAFRTTVKPASFAIAIASHTSRAGTSSCVKKTSPGRSIFPAPTPPSCSFAFTVALAPAPTQIWFSPRASTITDAHPVRAALAVRVARCVASTPASANASLSIAPKASSPTAPTNFTTTSKTSTNALVIAMRFRPRPVTAHAHAAFAPFPPGASAYDGARTVTPGAGRTGARIARSTFAEPKTTTAGGGGGVVSSSGPLSSSRVFFARFISLRAGASRGSPGMTRHRPFLWFL
mmetsp:Transcript_537/g.1705  ORF Transcript_537/g.1705 Transcript_537/m.1705 type:complete len:367 (-) Transcript_537:99-1199(-)